MKRSITLFSLLFLALIQASSQEDASGIFNSTNDGIAGNPFLVRGWSDGSVRFSSGRSVRQFKLKFDCAKNQLLLQFSGSTFAAESKVSEFVLYPKGFKNDSMIFRKGFPAFETANAETFYQVLAEGKLSLLKLCVRVVVEEAKLIKSERQRRYEEREDYFLMMNGVLAKIGMENKKRLNIEALPEQFADLRLFDNKVGQEIKSVSGLIDRVRAFNAQ